MLMFKRLLRVYGHLYSRHFSDIRESDVELSLNSSFVFFYAFLQAHELLEEIRDPKAEPELPFYSFITRQVDGE